ncbi:MAG: hypothetical protein O7E57_16430, partial [Gammaproteobacteria bacterium]|nr:hypothetical protein [Gammaproteobacteria bacterium]
FGDGVVTALERFDAAKQFDWCGTVDGNVIVGTNFPITPGTGYALHSISAHEGVNLNDLADAVCIEN